MSSSMFRRRSRSRVRRHRAQWRAAIAAPQLAPCPTPDCGEPKLGYAACAACGRYNGRQVIAPKRDR